MQWYKMCFNYVLKWLNLSAIMFETKNIKRNAIQVHENNYNMNSA